MRRTHAPLVLFPLTVSSLAQATTYTVDYAIDPPTGSAANCVVGNNNTCTLRDAISAAVGGDTINFAVVNIQLNSGNSLSLTDTSGSVITIDGGGSVELDGNHATRIFSIGANTKVSLKGLTIVNGQVAANQYGGAIASAGNLTITNSVLSGNTAGAGGGISNDHGTLTISSSVIANNVSINSGGGIFSTAGTIVVTNSTISGNESQYAGGGIFGSNVGMTSLTISDSTVSGNYSRYNGGGIENAGGTITNSTVANNASHLTNGGGFFNFGTLALLSSTFAGNTDHTSGENGIASSGGTLLFVDSIISDGCSGTPTVIDSGGNLDSGTSCGLTASTSKSSATINLGVLQPNGGPTETMLPGNGSDAINAIACTNAPPFDQRGLLRPDPSSKASSATPCDIGAVEVNSIPDVIFINGFEP